MCYIYVINTQDNVFNVRNNYFVNDRLKDILIALQVLISLR